MASVKFKNEEEYLAFQKKMEREVPAQTQRGADAQNVKTYYERQDARGGSVEVPKEQIERAELNKKLRESQSGERKPSGTIEKIKRVAEIASKDIFKKREEQPEKKKEDEEKSEMMPPVEKRPLKKAKSKKKSGGSNLKELFDEEDFDEDFTKSPSRGGKSSPIGRYESAYQHNRPVPYESAYSGSKVMGGKFQEAYTRKTMAADVYRSPGNPKTYEMSMGEQPRRSSLRPTQQMPSPQKARAQPMPMPKIGSFNDNIKMPTASLGNAPRAHKMGSGNMPSINIPTLGGSTLVMGSGSAGKTANNNISVNNFDIPKVGNWGKAPLKTKLETPNIGSLTIMGAGKKKGGIGISLGGELPRFGLGTPGKRKK